MKITENNLFYNIEESERETMMTCFNTFTKTYRSGEIILFYDEDDKGIGIVESGEACVIHCNSSGTRTILEHLTEGDIFGQLFYYYAGKENITVEAVTNCNVRYIDFEHIVKRCSKACAHHSQLVNNILLMVSDKTQSICEHLEVLSQRTIRDRLMTYFEILAAQNDRKTFTLPFTMSALADYLSVDRSAMSRELSKMKEEGLIQIDKRKVTITNSEY
jgi:CRP-like cAMP-binding protein